MYSNLDLKNHLENSSVIKNQSLITMEWNLNDASNIEKIGNYLYNPLTESSPLSVYDPQDSQNKYKNGTDADVVITGGVTDSETNTPITFKSNKEKNHLYFSLEDCFGRFRPRSGINKFLYFDGKKIPEAGPNLALRPRYYFADKSDKFKYWSSYRTVAGEDRGLSASTKTTGGYTIKDVAPFIVYKNAIPTNKIVIKIQTNVGMVSTSNNDPFYGTANMTTPVKWKLQKLSAKNTNYPEWQDIVSYDSMPGPSAMQPTGYLEFSYGLIIPDQYLSILKYAGTVSSNAALPEKSSNGYAYLIRQNEGDLGVFAIWLDSAESYAYFSAKYGWYQTTEELSDKTSLIRELTNMPQFYNESGDVAYREFDKIRGLRVVVDEMNTPNSTFDLIELSPRLYADVSDRASEYSITKQMADMSGGGLPVGKMLASTGSLSLFDHDQAFSENNTNSVLHGLPNKSMQVKIYEAVFGVETQGTLTTKDTTIVDFYIPIKTMYVEDFPQVGAYDRRISMTLRDLTMLFETTIAPQMLLTNQSLSYILVMLFDSIGFSNYRFYRLQDEHDDVIPYFFIGPDTSIAQVLEQLSISTQTAMFFNENNDFVLMSKNYVMPTATERPSSMTISADKNILGIASKDNTIYNSGKITYVSRYIQKTYGAVEQSEYSAQNKTWIYKPVLLWEVSPSENSKSVNEETSNASSFVLGAIPLNTTLSNVVPYVENGIVKNNVLDLGEGAELLPRYNGYFYANGEVIKFDAIEHFVAGVGTVWISSVQEYQNYFSKLSFNGRIYPTGKVRIYSEAVYNNNSIVDGPVAKHGRGQFGTNVVEHPAGLSSSWSSQTPKICYMSSDIILNDKATPATTSGKAGTSPTYGQGATVNGIIKNFLSTTTLPEANINALKSASPGTVQSSAMILNGPSFATSENPIDYMSYVYKELGNKFVHFGTRLRIVGSISNTSDYVQKGVGSSTMYTVPAQNYTKTITNSDGSTYNVQVSTKEAVVGGSSGGIGVLVNPETNNGYYFEIAALTENNVNNYSGNTPINNIFFYKIQRDADSATTDKSKALPTLLWSGLAPVLVDDGKFTGQSRTMGEQNPTVYDLAVEYEDIGGTRKFYLYINNRVIAVVTDTKPLPHVNDNNVALFTRGSSRLMFENVYALATNYAQDTSSLVKAPFSNGVFSSGDVSVTDSFRKYAISGMISSTYLSGIGSNQPPEYIMYYDEFGTIMREAAYMNVRYDKAYPALTAKISPTFNNMKGYTISGFSQNPYGAEFMVFNNTDTMLTLDESGGNYLRIQGVTFTQQSQNELTVDEYFSKVSDFSGYRFDPSATVKASKQYEDIKASRLTYGKKEFTLDAPFIQSQDSAKNLMAWVIQKVMKPRMSVGLEVFGLPIVQLGDIVKVSYTRNNIDELSDSRFVVYNIQTSKSESGPKTTIYLSEVV